MSYAEQIEREFIGLRGAPLMLGPDEARLIAEWERAGVPVHLVLDAIREVFEDRDGPRLNGRPMPLRYCRPAVEEAWQTYRELIAQGGALPG